MKRRFLKHRTIFLLALLIMGFAACKKDSFLNVPDKGALTDQSTFSSQANADLFVNDIYKNLPYIRNKNQFDFLEQYSDNSNCGATWEAGQSLVRAGAINPSNVPGGPSGMWSWEGTYTNIRKCNVFLQEAAANKGNFSATWYTERVAEVTFLRAYFYQLLFTAYGGVPIITVPLDNLTQGNGIFYARSTADQTLAFIEADCDAAAAALPLTQTGVNTGRPTKGAALTLKGWAELWAASPLSNPNNDVTKWAKAAATNLQVMNLGTYSLFPDFAGQFLAANNFNTESIFTRGSDGTPVNGSAYEGTQGPVYVKGVQEGWGNLQPTQSLVDDFSMDNGLPITDPASGYDPQHPYTHREKRFYASIIYDGSEWQGDTIFTRNTTTANNRIDLGSVSDISNTGYYGKKILDESINAQTSLNLWVSKANTIYFRYGEVLLSYAEAQNEAVGPDATVYAAVNAVRARSSLPGVTPGLSQSQMRTVLRRERRVELAFEDKRWFDIRRWDITAGPTGVLNTPTFGMVITQDPVTNKLTYTPTNVLSSNTYFERQNWMPIPIGDIEKNPKLVQNPGY